MSDRARPYKGGGLSRRTAARFGDSAIKSISCLLLAASVLLTGCDRAPVPAPRFSGDPVPDFTLRELTATGIISESRTLADYRGEVVVLDFWATWCLACLQEFPAVAKLAEEYQNQEVRFLGVVWKDSQGKATRFLAQHESPALVHLWDDEGVGEAYGLPGLPAAFIIGRDGRLVLSLIGNAPSMVGYLRQDLDSLLAL